MWIKLLWCEILMWNKSGGTIQTDGRRENGLRKVRPGAACWEPRSGEGGHAVWMAVATSGKVGSIIMVTIILHKGSVEGGSAVGPSSGSNIVEHYHQHHVGAELTLNWEPGSTQGFCLLKGLFFHLCSHFWWEHLSLNSTNKVTNI